MPDYFYDDDYTPRVNPLNHLRERRIVPLYGAIDDAKAYEVTLELMCLDEESHAPIFLLINSPGGSVSAGFAIIDCMNSLASEVHTRATGTAASMAAVVLACGTKGERTATPHADIMVHQPLQNGLGGQASDIAIAANEIMRKRKKLNALLAEQTGRSIDEIEQATDRNNWLSAEDAVEFGIVDRVSNTI
ncbi:MAG: ATP-dependent Clp protease proteolytic subunit [Eggerthellaceae bacterium]|nr:ATP-dependent Clp protease proteolytic subunit [Eggerthellaceae bacterium]